MTVPAEPAPLPPDLFAPCNLCPRRCGVDRRAALGVCREPAAIRLSHALPHFGEEPCFTGTRGSGALFLSGCSCHCIFCQNWQISSPPPGTPPLPELSPDEFHGVALDLVRRGVHNLNFVTPTHVWPLVRDLCLRLRAEGHALPVILNSSGYELPEHIPAQAAVADIFLPDFKFASPDLARTVTGDPSYPDFALRALRRMIEAKGFLYPFDPTGREPAREGVLVRHLLLPGHLNDTRRVLTLLRDEFGRHLPLSLMSQYLPVPPVAARPPFDRPPTPDEYRQAVECAEKLEFDNLFIQPLADTSGYLPDFTRPAPFPDNPA